MADALDVPSRYLDRFWSMVGKGDEGECWDWVAGVSNRGYGTIRWPVEGGPATRTTSAHRVSYAIANGPIPAGLHVCHTCDRPICVNPAHLFLGTHADNMADRSAKGRLVNPNLGVTHCIRGHEFTEENTYRNGKRRQCRTCQRLRQQRYQAARKLALVKDGEQ